MLGPVHSLHLTCSANFEHRWSENALLLFLPPMLSYFTVYSVFLTKGGTGIVKVPVGDSGLGTWIVN